MDSDAIPKKKSTKKKKKKVVRKKKKTADGEEVEIDVSESAVDFDAPDEEENYED
jgi:hypothetical protein|tara:strand:+ start:144 stop:308 length:165 start_codon:yes stop_codon:yes gene_type:complete